MIYATQFILTTNLFGEKGRPFYPPPKYYYRFISLVAYYTLFLYTTLSISSSIRENQVQYYTKYLE